MDNKKVGIIGVGMVGGAIRRYLENNKKIQPFLYDPGKNLGSLDEVNQADIIFVSVPTPYKKQERGFDLSFVEEAFNNIKGEKVVVIKSTVVPGTTEMFQQKYPQHKVLFNPEFLTELTADQDMSYPDRQIVGYTEKSYNVAGDLMQLLPLAPFEKIMPATEAELVKYFGNTWFSTKVIFANQVFDLCDKLGVDYTRIMEAAAADKRIGRSHLEVWHKGYRGYGGKCLEGNEIVYELTEDGLKITPIKDFKGKTVLSGRDGRLFVDEVVAYSKRLVNKTIKFHFSKGRTLETSPDHLMPVFDKNKGLIEKEAKNVRADDKIPVLLGQTPFLNRSAIIDFFEFFGRKNEVFIEEPGKNCIDILKPFLTFQQYKSFRRERNSSLPALAL